MLLMIDNYDSFTFNLVQYFGELGCSVKVVRNDEIASTDIASISPDHIVLSPGPCDPDKAGICLQVVRDYMGKIPLFGVCLGCQVIGQALGGKIVQAKQVMHGKLSPIHHNDLGIYQNLPNPFQATRYHSLVVEQASLPNELEITSWTVAQDQTIEEIMGVKHKNFPLEGVQFHPESILSEHGKQLLKNFIDQN